MRVHRPGGHHRQRVVGPAGVDAADQQRGATLLGGGGEAVDPLRRRGPRVVERVQRRRHDVRARAQAALDVGDGLVGADVAGRHVGDGVAVGQRGVDVRGGERRRSARRRPANVAASRPALSSEEVMTPASRSPGKATVDRIAVAPMLPVPHTTTRLIRPTLAGVLGALVADITVRENSRSECGTYGDETARSTVGLVSWQKFARHCFAIKLPAGIVGRSYWWVT